MFKLKRSILWFLPLGILVVALSACSGGANAEPTQDPNVVFTQVAETVMVSMTQTAEAAPPTATPEPTATQIPTAIPTATTDPSQVTPVATTIVVQPSSPSGIPTATTQRYGDGAKWNTQSPADGTVLEKSQNFAFHVCLGNIGSTDWTTKYYLQYVSGQQLWWNTTTFNLGDTVKPGDKWCFDLPSIAPSKAGEYTTRWYLKNAT